MARTIEVTPELLRTAADKIAANAEDYQKLYEHLYQKADAMASSWQGKDNLAYIDQIKGFLPELKFMYNELTMYVKFLRTTATTYENTQKAVADTARKLKN
ncbi:MAG: WXG100 family type VII secretion target [Lachnospiraceae bacterium]|nr:WXG100 family type VII secretion target [Lachnospiraceae bacterium]